MPELILNGGFESLFANWTMSPAASWGTDGSNPLVGTLSALTTQNDQLSGDTILTADSFAVTPGKAFSITAVYRQGYGFGGPLFTPNNLLVEYDPANTGIWYTLAAITPPGDGDAHAFASAFRATGTTAAIRFRTARYVNIGIGNVASWFLDAVSVQLGTSAPLRYPDETAPPWDGHGAGRGRTRAFVDPVTGSYAPSSTLRVDAQSRPRRARDLDQLRRDDFPPHPGERDEGADP